MKRYFSFLLAGLFLLAAGCTAPTVGDVGAIKQFFAMNTVMTITVNGSNGEAALKAARTEVDRLEHLLSRTREESTISQLNRHAGDGTAVVVEPALLALLAFAKDVGDQTAGALDITIAPVMDAWGFTTDHLQVPSADRLAALLPLVDDQSLLLDNTTGTAQLAQSGMKVDLGAVAKGFAAGQAIAAIRGAGATSALLDLGGNISAIGTKADGAPWRVAVKNPTDPSTYFCILSLSDRTAATSGGYERYFEENGVGYHHIIDPATGYPASSGLTSVTVISEDPTLADALSTSLFILGEEQALALWRTNDNFELILCRADNVVLVTDGLEPGFEFRGEDDGYTYEIIRR